ncbi:bactofilin family protein [Ovoidimarina sediminis]|uniref:bactofilin family protein n=1 Tax=Ovoidimarina sediminis TaxID=3079856 RepID=UPI0029084D17|nr:polymer-forming cytoskeletal protein [Rhodophyticola sp. MJ-SS7]MDU8945049.1 polymer-forming cytoskeletal protein [Rhodophyticola sp. MJ-SS7]
MFSKSRVSDSGTPETPSSSNNSEAKDPMDTSKPSTDYSTSSAPKAKPPASVLSSDLTITGNLKTAGDIQIEGTVEGDIRAHILTVGEGATVKGECMADDVIVNGRIIGRVRGLKVRLTATAKVEGDIIHKTIAIESGAHFEGSVQRQEDPLSTSGKPAPKPAPGASPTSSSSSPQPAAAGAKS